MLDSDVGFMFALSHELTARGISAYPARTVPEARLTMQRFRLAPEVLVIDCAVPAACPFAEEEAELIRNLAVVGFVSAGHQCGQCAELLAKTLSKPNGILPQRIPYCADVIQGVLKGLGHNGHAHAT